MTGTASPAVAVPVLAVEGITKAFRSGPPWHRRRVEVQMAEDIISAQTKEIAQMRKWHTAWYGADMRG